MIFEYDNYLKFINNYLERHVLSEEFSLRKVAKRLQVDHSVLSRVMSGKRKMPIDLADQLANLISLKAIEREYFLLLVEIDHVKTKRAKELLAQEIKYIQKQRSLPSLKKHEFEVIADLDTLSVLEIVSSLDEVLDSKVMAKRLGINQKKVEEIFQLLKKENIISEEGDKLRRTNHKMSFKINSENKKVEDFFLQVINRVKTEIQSGNAEKRIFRTRITMIPKSKRKEICLMIDSFLGKLQLFLEDYDSKKEDLVCINFCFFDLFKDEN